MAQKFLAIGATPNSITIVDHYNNRLVIRREASGIIFYTSGDTDRVNKNIVELQTAMKKVLTGKGIKDNYKVRFEKLCKHLTSVQTHSFVSLRNSLQTI